MELLLRTRLFGILLAVGGCAGVASADGGREARLTEINAAFRAGGGAAVKAAARERKELLRALLASAPEAVLRSALPASVRHALPAEVQPYLEHELRAEGRLEVVVHDYEDRAVVTRTLVTAEGVRFGLHVAGPVPDLSSGSRVVVEGLAIDADLVVAAEALSDAVVPTSLQVAQAAAVAGTTGSQYTLVLPANYASAPPPTRPWTREQIADVITAFNPYAPPPNLVRYILEVSYSQSMIIGNTLDWRTLPSPLECDLYAVLSDVVATFDADVDFRSFDRLVLVIPHLRYCEPALGWGTVGKITFGTGDGPVTASVSWIADLTLKTVAHEFGHNLGLHHADGLECGPARDAVAGCSSADAKDYFSVMGYGAYGPVHVSAAERDRLGWFRPGDLLVAGPGTDRTYTLNPVEVAFAPKALKIVSHKTPLVYYVEFRQPYWFDQALDYVNPAVYAQALVRRYDPASGVVSLIDITPGSRSSASNDFVDAGLAVATTFTTAHGATVTPSSATPSALTVRVTVPGGC